MLAAGFKIIKSAQKVRWDQDRRFKVTYTQLSIGETTADHPNGDDPRRFIGVNAHTDSKMNGWCIYNYGAYLWVDTEEEAISALERIVEIHLEEAGK